MGAGAECGAVDVDLPLPRSADLGGGGIMGEKWESGGIRCNFGVKLGGLGVGFGGGGIWRAVLFGAGV